MHIMHTYERITPYQDIRIGNEAIKNGTSHPYLGVTMDTKLHFGTHVTAVVSRVRARLKNIDWLINKS
ncbi:hypothetical protein AWZ03_015498, partial [Drosophila navojoa]